MPLTGTRSRQPDPHDDRAREILSAWDIHMDSSQSVSLDIAPGSHRPGTNLPCGRWSAEWIEKGRAFLASELRRVDAEGEARGLERAMFACSHVQCAGTSAAFDAGRDACVERVRALKAVPRG